MKVLMVCLGNICRSPIADGLLRKKVSEHGLNIEVDSAGTGGYHIGASPDTRMIEVSRQNGTDISFLKARKFDVSDFDTFDLIIPMDSSNKKDILKLARSEKDEKKVFLLLGELTNQDDSDVPDPYYGGKKDFEHVYHLIDNATDILLNKLKTNTLPL